MTIIYKGIIFPDVIQALIDTNYIESYSDMAAKLERTIYPETTGDADRFRELSRIQKMFNGEGKVPAENSKKVLYKFTERLKPHFDFNIKVPLSDYRLPGGNYIHIKNFFLGQNIETTSDEKQALLTYVLSLCEEEKSILKRYDPEEIANVRRNKFHISDDSLETELLKIFPDIKNFENQNEKIVETLSLVVKTHQYLHLFAILEQHIYILYGQEFTLKQLRERRLITRLLPSLDSKGKYNGAVKKLIISLYKGLGFTSQSKFSSSLCREGIDEQSSINRKLNRWKSGKSRITPKALNDLFQRNNDAFIPDELILIASLIDITTRDLIDTGLPEKWIIDEFQKYKLYQHEIVDELGTPYLKTLHLVKS